MNAVFRINLMLTMWSSMLNQSLEYQPTCRLHSEQIGSVSLLCCVCANCTEWYHNNIFIARGVDCERADIGTVKAQSLSQVPRLFHERFEWESNPHIHISCVMLYTASQSKVVGKKGVYKCLVPGNHHYFLMEHP